MKLCVEAGIALGKTTLLRNLKQAYPLQKEFRGDVESLLNIECLLCLQIFDTQELRQKHTEICLTKFATLSVAFGEPLEIDFSINPFLLAKEEQKD